MFMSVLSARSVELASLHCSVSSELHKHLEVSFQAVFPPLGASEIHQLTVYFALQIYRFQRTERSADCLSPCVQCAVDGRHAASAHRRDVRSEGFEGRSEGRVAVVDRGDAMATTGDLASGIIDKKKLMNYTEIEYA
jgi:hypothetical protein